MAGVSFAIAKTAIPAPRILKKSRRAQFELMHRNGADSFRSGSMINFVRRYSSPVLLHHLGCPADRIDDARMRTATAHIALTRIERFPPDWDSDSLAAGRRCS